MRPFLTFRGELGRGRFAAGAIGAFVSQYVFAAAVIWTFADRWTAPWWFWVNPLRAMATLKNPAPSAFLLWAMTMILAVDWVLASMAFRRARQAGQSGWLAALTLVPIVQIPVILWLSVAPPSPGRSSDPVVETSVLRIQQATLGLLVGVVLSVAAVAFSTLFLHTYGYGLFIGSPFIIGMATGYTVNRRAVVDLWDTFTIVVGALWLGGIALLGFAFEGVICLVLASPLILGMGILGGALGRAFARIGRPASRSTLVSLTFALPVLLASETSLPPKASFESIESVEVAASPGAVWDSIVHMGPIPDAPAAPFRWGLAYPLRGEILGQGVGALRRGVFSTGVAYEKITTWEPDHRLDFIVLSDPPTMRELSPYAHVNAPHVTGYFRTLDARFTIQSLANGKTRLSLATKHELDLEPALYWLPLAQWAVYANKVRVLAHFRDQAEGRVPTPPKG